MTVNPYSNHEIITSFAAQGLPLSDELVEMLSEHYSHRSERRGCGYTQASRALAVFINNPRVADAMDDLRVFAKPDYPALKALLQQASDYGLPLSHWRSLDERVDVRLALRQTPGNPEHARFLALLASQVEWQATLREMTDKLVLPESRVLVQMLVDLVLPRDPAQERLPSLTALADKPKVGSCTMAEKFFLELVYGAVPRKARINIIVDERGQPLLLEKLYTGDSHSCLSLTPVIMNGVRIPAGGLFAAPTPEQDAADSAPPAGLRPCRQLKGQIMALSAYSGFRFLRLTTLAVPPACRQRAFTSHYAWQERTGCLGYATTDIRQFMELAQNQL